MIFPRFQNRIGNVCALVAATLVLPALAFAGTHDDKGDDGKKNSKQKGHDPISVVPEANVGWVLIPSFGAVLLFSWRQFTRAKAGCQENRS
jgi:hypothetical protein